MRLRLELTEVACWNPEDHLVPDMFYLTGGIAVGSVTAPIALSPMGMRRRQVRRTWPEHSVVLDTQVPDGASINIGMRAFEEDFAGDWSRMREWVLVLAAEIAGRVGRVDQGDRPFEVINKEQLAAIVEAASTVFDFLAKADEDDVLGTYEATIGPGQGLIHHGEAQFKGSGITGDWDYVVRYRYALPDQLPSGQPAVYGATTRLLHTATTRVLHSHDLGYGHSRGSGQQQVTAYDGVDDNDLWRIKPAHGHGDVVDGSSVQHGDTIRLEHLPTRRNLHSHPGFVSPVTAQQEVTCFGDAGEGDAGDDWRVEVEGGGTWVTGTTARLIHVATGCALHSHYGQYDAVNTADQQEVTAFAGRDANDLWQLAPA